MVSTTPKTILLKGTPQYREGVANAAITPGYLVEQMSTGKFRKHATAAVRASAMFAIEQDYVGKAIDTAYAANDQLRYLVAQRGDQVYALVAASAAAIVIGDFLESAGDGTLRKWVAPLTAASGTGDGTVADVGGSFSQTTLNNNFQDIAGVINGLKVTAIARAVEAVDNSAGGSEARIRVEVI